MVQINQLEAQMDAAIEFISDPVAGATKMAEASAYTWDALATGIPTSNCIQSKPVDGKPGLISPCGGTSAWLPERIAGITGIAERNGKYCKGINPKNKKKQALRSPGANRNPDLDDSKSFEIRGRVAPHRPPAVGCRG